MATRSSLVSRGFTSVAAGPSSTNRFLKPPRAVGEYTTVAEDLRATKNAVGPAAQPLRPRARVDTGGGGDGYSPTDAESPQVNYGKKDDGSYYISTPDLSKQVQKDTAKLTDTKNLRTGIGLLGPTPVGLAFGALGLLAGSEVNRATDALYDRGAGENILAPDTDFDKTDNFVQQQMNNVARSVLSSTREVGDFVRNPGKAISGVVKGIETDLDELGNRIVTGAETIIGKFTPSALPKIYSPTVRALPRSPPVVRALTRITPTKVNKTNRKQVEERAIESRANQEIQNRKSMEIDVAKKDLALDIQKRASQEVTLAQKQQAINNIAAGNYKSSGSDDGSFDSGADKDGNATGQDQYD